MRQITNNTKNRSNGRTKLCGCYRKDKTKSLKHIIFQIQDSLQFVDLWKDVAMIKEYKNYGGRCIKVCDEWLNSLESFTK